MPRHPFLATITVASGIRGREEVEVPYAEAIALAIQTNAPILIDQDMMKQTSPVVEAERAKVRNELKDYLESRMGPKRSREVLQGQLQEAIQHEEYELAAIISEELKILSELSMEKTQ